MPAGATATLPVSAGAIETMVVEQHRRRVESCLAGGQWALAVEALVAWRADDPSAIEPELLHVRIELGQDRYREARDRLLRAVARFACPAHLVREVATSLRFFVAHDAMIGWAEAYPERAAIAALDQALTARILSAIGAQSLARDWIGEAVEKVPDDGDCLANRALIRSFDGDLDRAHRDLRRILDAGPSPASAWWQLVQLGSQSDDTDLIERLRARIAASSSPRDRAYLHFALFKVLDRRGEHEPAWSALAEGCRIARRDAPYRAQVHEHLFAAMKRRFPLDDEPQEALAVGPIPIFIVGMHRSGTTLLERILGAHEQVAAYGESQRLSQALRYATGHYCPQLVDADIVAQADRIDHALVARQYLMEGKRRIGEATHVTEKMPGNFQLIGFIRQALPQARVIHLRRDPMDVCFANLREYFVDGVRYSNSMEDLGHFHAGYIDLMAHWHVCYPGFILDVDYEALVADPVTTSQRIFGFCGLSWNPQVLELSANADKPTNTLSAVQVRNPISTASVGRWKPYARWLEPLRSMLGA
jgi:tetratricopeptide (TPR) repeat protein